MLGPEMAPTWPQVVNNALNVAQLVLLAWIARNGHASLRRDRPRSENRD
jgi:hypothetical protein